MNATNKTAIVDTLTAQDSAFTSSTIVAQNVLADAADWESDTEIQDLYFPLAPFSTPANERIMDVQAWFDAGWMRTASGRWVR